MVELYSHQREALDKLKTGSILCGGVGSGKSRTSLAYYFYKVCGGYISKREGRVLSKPLDLYIITTAKKRDSFEWDEELLVFGLSQNKETNPSNVNVVIDSWNNIHKYVGIMNAFFIFDEQRVVGSGSWARNFIKISKLNDWILLTATPGDTWMDYIPVFIANGFYRNRSEFVAEHVVYNPYIRSFRKVDHFTNVAKLAKYREDILVYMVCQKPATQHHEDIVCGYDRDAYQTIAKHRWNLFENVPVVNASECCSLMRRIVNSSSDRQIALMNLVNQYKKVIIFYNFDYELEILETLCGGTDKEIRQWNGHKHEQVPTSDKWVYLVQYFAGAEAWNCVQTNVMIFYSASYSYKMMTQAAGRIDRMNTPYKDLYYYHLRSDSSIDLGIKNCLEKKEDFNEKTFYNEMTQI